MRTRHRALAIVAAVGATVVAAPAMSQEPVSRMLQQQQMLQMQEQVARMNETMQQMHQIQERAHQLEQNMVQEMERLWRHQGIEEGVSQQLEIQNHERLRLMAQALDESAKATYRAMEQFRQMVGEPAAGWNAEAEHDLERLRLHWEQMAGQMEEGLTLMERLRDRLNQPGSGS